MEEFNIQSEILLQALASGLIEAGLALSQATQIKLVEYIKLLAKWNAAYNLTAVRDPLDMIKKHVLDSLILLPFLTPDNIADVGTGAGLPGIPLALACPQAKITLLDSQQKKIAFVEHVILSLQLRNALALKVRVEDYQPALPFQWVVSRAFASLRAFIEGAQHLCASDGKLIAMKGDMSPEELAEVPSGFSIERLEPVKVPGINAARSLVFVTRKSIQGEIKH